MDRSYWSNQEVVLATRDFVCIRLATYEDQKEVDFLKTIFRGRSGSLENTVFAMLDSDGKTKLGRSGRSPDFAFRGVSGFVDGLKKMSAERKLKSKRYSDTKLPLMKNVDLALNVASCDKIQLIIIVGEDDEKVEQISKRALKLAWGDKTAGQYVFATTTDAKELETISGQKIKNGIVVVEPGQFGMSGDIVATFKPEFDLAKSLAKLVDLAKNYEVLKEYRSHIRMGISLGIDWKTETPVTDRESNMATERSRGRKE